MKDNKTPDDELDEDVPEGEAAEVEEGPSDDDIEEAQKEEEDDDLGNCPACGAKMHEGSDRCPKCGQYVEPKLSPTGKLWLWGAVLAGIALLIWLIAR